MHARTFALGDGGSGEVAEAGEGEGAGRVDGAADELRDVAVEDVAEAERLRVQHLPHLQAAARQRRLRLQVRDVVQARHHAHQRARAVRCCRRRRC